MTLHVRRTAVAFLLCSLALPAWGQQYYLYEPKPVSPDVKREAGDGVLVSEIPINDGDTLYGISKRFSGHGTYYPQILLFNNIKDPNLIYTGDTIRIPLPKDGPAEAATQPKKKHGKTLKYKTPIKKKASASTATPASKKQSSKGNTGKDKTATTEISLKELKNMESRKGDRRSQKKRTADTNVRKSAVDDAQLIHRREEIESTPKQQKADVAPPRQAESNAVAGQQLFERAVKAYRQDDFRTALDLFDRYLADNPNSPMAADASLYKAECYLKLSAQ
ncbi:MAG: hypothetical protein A2X82_00585 [Geobacteraceae bacterium GWC2_55_20]|nr:MAG: hypothetical protein A2X82_00585 [Geobacteraceae bacterium GWC2_55_20]OGU22515.1 MAG: hypothetical protein A2X85_15915 [Geobacteraceae bacterium GWF2_54_21]